MPRRLRIEFEGAIYHHATPVFYLSNQAHRSILGHLRVDMPGCDVIGGS
jgi:hypothetical protein